LLLALTIWLSMSFSDLARQEGLEPPTYGFGDRRSAN
jgi:hypothetical protein